MAARLTFAHTDRQEAAERAELRLWGSSTYVPSVGNRRMLAVGVAEGGEVRSWTRRTASGALDGASLSGWFEGVR